MKNLVVISLLLIIPVNVAVGNPKSAYYGDIDFNNILNAINEEPHGSVLQKIMTKNFVKELDRVSKISASTACFGCEAGVLTLQSLLKLGLGHNAIAAITSIFCQLLHVQAADVCKGLVDGLKDELLDVLQNVTLPRSVVCYHITGEQCYPDYNEPLEWNVTFHDVPKPPVKPPISPKEGKNDLRVLHLADIHVDMRYKPGSNANCGKPLCCQSGDPIGEPAGKWGDYRNCDTPRWTVENLFQHLSKQKFDYILWTGDLYSHEVWTMSKPDQIELLDYLTSLFLTYFPHTLVYPSLGNHEGVPLNSFPQPFITGNDSTAWLYDQLYSRWKSWLPAEANLTITRGGFYTTVVKKGLRIISLNLNYCHRGNWWLMLNSTDPTDQLQWLVGVLQNAEAKKEKVHIIGHIAPGISDCLKTWSWNYYKIINRYEATITGQFFGHAHTDYWEMFYDEADGLKRPLSIAYLAPSVTTYSNLNPSYRIYNIEGFHKNSNHMVLDHETWIVNLTEANKQDNLTWFKEYSAKEAYDMQSLLPSEWDRVTRELLTNDTMFTQYYRHYYNSNPPSTGCDRKCREYLVCQLLSGRSHDPDLCRFTRRDLVADVRERYAGLVHWSKVNTNFC